MTTDAQQRNIFSAGFALGVLAVGRTEVRGSGLTVWLAFRPAWRGWAHSGRFPRIAADLRGDRAERLVITHASESHTSADPFWVSEGGAFVPVRRNPDDETTLEELAHDLDDELPLQAWVELVDPFFTLLDRFPRRRAVRD